MGARHGPARRRQPHRQVDPDLRARRAAALRRHQHLPQGALCRERPRRRQIRRRRHRHPVRFRHHLPARHALRAAGHPPHLGALHALQLRARRRSARADDAVRRRRRLHHPGQPREELRPDHPRRRACLLVRRAAADARRRPFDRLSLRARHRQCTSKRIGIIHFDRHIDIQEKDLDERMHTTPWYWATNLPNVPATNLVQLGIGGWQVPRDGVAGGAQARHQRADHRRHREARPREDRRDRARARLEGRRRRLHLLRRRLRSIAASCPAPAGPSPAASCRARR